MTKQGSITIGQLKMAVPAGYDPYQIHREVEARLGQLSVAAIEENTTVALLQIKPLQAMTNESVTSLAARIVDTIGQSLRNEISETRRQTL